MSVSAKEQAKAQSQDDTRDLDVDAGMSDSKPWSGIQPRYMSVDQENHSQYNPEEVGTKPEQLRSNRVLREKPSTNKYNQGPS